VTEGRALREVWHKSLKHGNINVIGIVSRLSNEDCLYYYLYRNNIVVLFGTLQVQSFILTGSE